MTERQNKHCEAIERLENALAEDILATSDEDILAEAREDGTDPEAVATSMQALFEQTLVLLHNSVNPL